MSGDLSLRDLPLTALECRDNRCQWDHVRKHDSREPMWGTYRWDRCERCGNWRVRIECSDGRVLSETTKYEYSPDYERALRFTREDCRLELNRRARVTHKTKGQAQLRSVG